jgi:hypothetical protein
VNPSEIHVANSTSISNASGWLMTDQFCDPPGIASVTPSCCSRAETAARSRSASFLGSLNQSVDCPSSDNLRPVAA